MSEYSWQQPTAPVRGPETMLGDIGISRHHVFLPTGAYPIAGTRWTITNGAYVVQRTSAAGTILAILLFPFLCFFSLFFLLMKEDRLEGSIQVHLEGPGFQHSAIVYAAGPESLGHVTSLVNWARACAGVG